MTHEEFRDKKKISSEQAHKELFEAYCGYVYTIVFNRLRSVAAREDIEECVCDVFADVYCYYDPGKNVSGDMSEWYRVFLSAIRLITPDSITHQFTKLLDENNLPHIRFHELRHSCISLLANNNAFSMKQIQDYAGHSDFLTTFNVYSHTDDSDKKTEMDYITSCFTDLFDTDKEE